MKIAASGNGDAVDPSRPIALIDGATVQLRQLGPDDYEAVVRLSETLTERERYMRFFTVHPGYLKEWARRLTTRSGEQYALGVFEGDELIGTASYVKTAQPGYAEISVVIAHLQHERGVGTALLRSLGRVARDNGIHRLVADVLAENALMRKVIADGRWPCQLHQDGSVISVDLNLDSDAGG